MGTYREKGLRDDRDYQELVRALRDQSPEQLELCFDWLEDEFDREVEEHGQVEGREE